MINTEKLKVMNQKRTINFKQEILIKKIYFIDVQCLFSFEFLF